MAKALAVGAAATKVALDAMLARLNGGVFRLLSSAPATLADVGFNATAFAGATSAVPSVATANALTPSGTPTAGTIASAQWRTSGAVVDVTFTIGTSNSDMIVADPVIPGGATSVTVSGLTFSLEIGPTP